MSVRRTVILTAQDAVALIKEERKRRGLQWAQLADMAQVSRTMLCNWAYGTRLPYLETALIVLHALGFDVIAERRKKD